MIEKHADVYVVRCAKPAEWVQGELKSCNAFVVTPKMSKEDVDALLALSNWRPGPDGKWLCPDYGHHIQGD